MTTTQRVEWRGDLFRADLPVILSRLSGAPIIPRSFPYTVTVFLQERGRGFNISRTLRIRAYCDLPDISVKSIRRFLDQGLYGKIQIKKPCGETVEMGNVQVLNGRTTPLPGAKLCVDGFPLRMDKFVASSVRVAERIHYSLDSLLTRGAHTLGSRESRRLTIDRQRHLFKIDLSGDVRYLGEMGPRVEIKAPTGGEVKTIKGRLNLDGIIKTVPYRSLELLLQDALRQIIPSHTYNTFPEIEVKFDLIEKGTRVLTAVLDLLSRRKDIRLLLPFPHRIVRMRRYHICLGMNIGEECVVVETTAANLSAKVKSGAAASGLVLLRNTRASHSTDLDGSSTTVEQFVAQRGWRRVNLFEKHQAKIPFCLTNGHSYLISLDKCFDLEGNYLYQLELEYIGSTSIAPESSEQILAEINGLASHLNSGPLGQYVQPTIQSKHEYFRQHITRFSGLEIHNTKHA